MTGFLCFYNGPLVARGRRGGENYIQRGGRGGSTAKSATNFANCPVEMKLPKRERGKMSGVSTCYLPDKKIRK